MAELNLPAGYKAYLSSGAPLEGFTSGNPGYFILWPIDEIEKSNREYEVASDAPGFLGFGSDGGGEMLAFDTAGAVYMLPFIGMEPRYANKIADSWEEFEQRITVDPGSV